MLQPGSQKDAAAIGNAENFSGSLWQKAALGMQILGTHLLRLSLKMDFDINEVQCGLFSLLFGVFFK